MGTGELQEFLGLEVEGNVASAKRVQDDEVVAFLTLPEENSAVADEDSLAFAGEAEVALGDLRHHLVELDVVEDALGIRLGHDAGDDATSQSDHEHPARLGDEEQPGHHEPRVLRDQSQRIRDVDGCFAVVDAASPELEHPFVSRLGDNHVVVGGLSLEQNPRFLSPAGRDRQQQAEGQGGE